MSNYCLDPTTGGIARWPWPQKDWLFNSHAIDAIRTVEFMKKLLEKQPELWTASEDEFYLATRETEDGDSNTL
jgi:hypothetical protein